MVNKRNKGMATMRKAREYGEKLGFKIEQALHTRYKCDYFLLFDQIWVRYGRVLFVQIKTNQSVTESIKQTFSDWSKKHCLETMIMNLDEKKGCWDILRFVPNEVSDEVIISKKIS